MKHSLFLASNSASRKSLLEQADIPFQIISQNADESLCDTNRELSLVVLELAPLKMNHAILPQGQFDGQIIFVLTADTLTKDIHGTLHGKPSDRDDAIRILKLCRAGTIIGTAFCLQKLRWQNDSWDVVESVIEYDQAMCVMNVPDEFLNFYLDRIPFLTISGAIDIAGIGDQFLEEVDGSYSAVLGLPMCKVRQSLYKLGFYE